jgi:hypothetical protein
MMECAHYRRCLLVDPHDPDPKLREHRETCQECAAYTERLLRFESRLDRALRAALPADAAAVGSDRVVSLRAARDSRWGSRRGGGKGWLAMAASVLMAAVLAGGLWLTAPGSSLAADVVAHMSKEPQAWQRTDQPVPSDELEKVLRNSHLRLAPGASLVSYASSCQFRGQRVPHFVIQTASGPVTVMVLVHERVFKTTRFDEQGYRGVIVPVAGHGSVAVLTRGTATDLESVQRLAAQVLDSIVWTEP